MKGIFIRFRMFFELLATGILLALYCVFLAVIAIFYPSMASTMYHRIISTKKNQQPVIKMTQEQAEKFIKKMQKNGGRRK